MIGLPTGGDELPTLAAGGPSCKSSTVRAVSPSITDDSMEEVSSLYGGMLSQSGKRS